AIPSLVLAKKPNARELFDKIAPYQGWAGVVFAIWGIWGIISCLINIPLLALAPVIWITWFLVSLLEASLGFILGYGLINRHMLSKNPEAAAKGEQVLKKLMPLQGILGIAAIVVGLWYIIAVIVLL
ncbi:MAG: hypothetical protein LIO77_07535, partial [Rikenellaceae bacterium]|nr:hypothetical protein [Rikenellaceae bacterium]